MNKWYEEKQCDNGIIISSRVRLARNLKSFPFPTKMSAEQTDEMITKVKDAIINDRTPLGNEFEYMEVRGLTEAKRRQLVEKHAISPLLASKSDKNGVLLKNDETVSIMLNEEDHIRIQTVFSGEDIDKAWDLADKIDDLIEESVEYAFSEKYGYVTACPTNMGTGLRASFMMHLPFLERSGQIKNVYRAVSKFGVTMRGIYGEGSEALGSIYQLSNQITMGQSEEEIIKNLKNVASFVKEQEEKIRERYLERDRVDVEDRIYRSVGLLANARRMSSAEAMKHLSNIREGYLLGLKDIPKLRETVYNVMINIQTGNVLLTGAITDEDVNIRDEKRAEYLRSVIKN